MQPRQFKDAVYEQFSRLGRAFSAPKRLELMELLSQGPRTVEDLANHAALSVANASQHLKVLRSSRLVDAEKKGLHVEYRLSDERVADFLLALRKLAENRLSELKETTRAYLEERSAMEPVAQDELMRRVRAGEVVVLDVRPATEYQFGHIPGALSIPLGELKARLKDIPKNQEVVAYCRGPYCVMAVEAVARLRDFGYTAFRMAAGVVDWRGKGWKIERGPEKTKIQKTGT